MTEVIERNQLYNCLKCKDRNWLVQCKCDDEICHEVICIRDKWGYIRYFKKGHQNRGKNNGRWNGGRILKDNYWFLKKPNNIHAALDGYLPEHIYVYTEFHKCCMLPWGHIHHKDPVRKDYCNNDILNLQGMTVSQHMSLHKKLESEKKKIHERICYLCGSDKTYRNPNTGVYWWNEVKDKVFRCDKCYRKDPLLSENRKKSYRKYNLKRKKRN